MKRKISPTPDAAGAPAPDAAVEIPEPFATALAQGRWADVADAPADSPAALYARGQARIQLGRDDDARADFAAARPALGNPCRIELAFLDIRQRRDIEGAEHVAHQVITLAEQNPSLQARAYHLAGLAEGKLRRGAAAIDSLLKAIAIYRKLEDFTARAQVYDTLGSLEAARGRLDFALHSYALSLVDKVLLNDKPGIALTLGNIGRVHLRLGRFADALDCFHRDLQLASDMGDLRGQARMQNDMGRAHLGDGDLPAAETELRRCINLSASHGYPDLSFFAHKDLALLRIAQGNFDEAGRLLTAAEKILPPGSEPYLADVLIAARGELALAMGSPEAMGLLEKAVAAFVEADLPDLEIPARISLARAQVQQKLKATAQDCLLKGMQRARSDGYARYLPVLKQEMARLDLTEGVIDETRRPIAASAADAASSAADAYVILQRLGGGGFGEVFRAYDPLAACDVAIKRFRLAHLYDVRRRNALIASAKLELEAASRVRHPGVVRVRAVGFDDRGELYLVSDYIHGSSLRTLLDQRQPLLVVRHLELIADALAALHQGGVVHRDLKPENVIVNSDALPVLVDFGIAQLARPASGASAVPVAGTPDYMAPEQAKGAAVDGKADLYALGVIGYEWLAGVLPIRPHATDLRQIAVELVSQQPTPLNKRRRDLDAELCKLIMSMLAKEPEDRPTAGLVANTCRQLATKIPASPAPIGDARNTESA